MGLNKVLFEGHAYMVDTDKYKFIARDEDGCVCAYESKPHISKIGSSGWVNEPVSYTVLSTGLVNWEDSCKGVEELIVNESKDVGVHPPFRYNGFMYENVDKDLKWIATDKNGRVYAYDEKPKRNLSHNHWCHILPDGEYELLAFDRPCEFFKWTGSLLEIEEILKYEN